MEDPIARELIDSEGPAWTRFVTCHPDANLYHTLEWRDFVKEVFGHKPLYLLAERRGEITGVLPMFLVSFPGLGSKIVALPYDIGSGGVLSHDAESERSLVEKAVALACEMRVNHLELRYNSERPALEGLGLQLRKPVLISEMVLDSEEQVWARIREDHRKAIRKASSRGVVVRQATALQDFRDFYGVYLRVFRQFGTPPYGGNYFESLYRRLYPRGAVQLLLAHKEGQCVGGLVSFCWGRTLVSKFAACLPEAVPLRGYVALYWAAIQAGLQQGYRRLSWGTSSREQTGLIDFKERWGATTEPAAIYYFPVRGGIPSIEKYYDSQGLSRSLWRLLPVQATRVGGELLSRWFC